MSQKDPFSAFRHLTRARIGLGRVGDALPTEALLTLRAAHARARDAVHHSVDFERIGRELAELDVMTVHSQALDRARYLRRPDLGRRLDPESLLKLSVRTSTYQLAVVVADGLSASAVAARATELVLALKHELCELRWAPLVLARQARVALGDEIASVLGAELVVVLIGERPGLSVSDSLGIYVTHDPRVGRRDSERNCISNVHEGGASVTDAIAQLTALVHEARRLGLTGVDLKLEPGGRVGVRLASGASARLVEPGDL